MEAILVVVRIDVSIDSNNASNEKANGEWRETKKCANDAESSLVFFFEKKSHHYLQWPQM